jgi:ABC-type oligopeptide transport system substrate-binding subunit
MMRTEFTHELERKKALHKMGKETIRWLVCNTQKKHLSTPEIRRALSLGIDRLSLCKDLLQREESPIYSILPKSLSFFPFAHQKQTLLQPKNSYEARWEQQDSKTMKSPLFIF